MDISWGSDAARKFVTNVGLITSDGPAGPNVMACEWTHQISYEPGLFLLSISNECTTVENVRATREFGVSLAADGQNVIAGIAGGSHGRDVDKLAVLEELGVTFYDATTIKAPMVAGAAMNAECRVVEIKDVGGQVAIIGEVVDGQTSAEAPLVYHAGRYYRLTEPVEKPSQEARDGMRSIVERHRRRVSPQVELKG